MTKDNRHVNIIFVWTVIICALIGNIYTIQWIKTNRNSLEKLSKRPKKLSKRPKKLPKRMKKLPKLTLDISTLENDIDTVITALNSSMIYGQSFQKICLNFVLFMYLQNKTTKDRYINPVLNSLNTGKKTPMLSTDNIILRQIIMPYLPTKYRTTIKSKDTALTNIVMYLNQLPMQVPFMQITGKICYYIISQQIIGHYELSQEPISFRDICKMYSLLPKKYQKEFHNDNWDHILDQIKSYNEDSMTFYNEYIQSNKNLQLQTKYIQFLVLMDNWVDFLHQFLHYILIDTPIKIIEHYLTII